MLCIWRYETGSVYYELLKPARPCIDRKMTRMCRKKWQRDFCYTRMHHLTQQISERHLETTCMEHSTTPAVLLDLAPSDYHLFASMGHAFAEQHFSSFQEVRKWRDEWFAAKDKQFF
ncbi:mariner Mos1 transposase [Trichonephila clavipes]|nr:mariner Mos1 transposase [Trichonephila clavipes]